jgi:hypothetical protein
VSAIRRHRKAGSTHETATDADLTQAFGPDRMAPPEHNDLLLVKNKPNGMNLGGGPTAIVLCRFVDYDGDGGHCQFFGTEWTCRLADVEVVQKVMQVWV